MNSRNIMILSNPYSDTASVKDGIWGREMYSSHRTASRSETPRSDYDEFIENYEQYGLHIDHMYIAFHTLQENDKQFVFTI